MKSFITFLVYSSQDPQKIALSVKAGSVFVISLLAMLNLDVDVTPLADQLIAVINAFLLLVSASMTLYGLCRKALTALGVW